MNVYSGSQQYHHQINYQKHFKRYLAFVMTLSTESAIHCQAAERGQKDREGAGNCPYLLLSQSLLGEYELPCKDPGTFLIYCCL